ncbi:retinoblastoma-like protein 1 [Ostrinia nubilalis]|uniref:retinoblastoma-like protein 1 n=1 Tax=Ostrinia nubilalis TaxID=29057 RepID=UPI003082493E
MAKPEENEEYWIEKMNVLCSDLNVDPAAAKKSKESFLEIKRNYTLDGDSLHWMACAMYVACRTSMTPTVQSGSAVESNCVSLTRLLRLCNISLIQFFTKIKNWMEMASMPNDFKERISRLEHKFAVSTVLFRNFQPMFQEIFSGLTNETIKSMNIKSKKHKWQPCSANALFEFTWCLYICVKGEFQNSTDLVDMYHMLLSCLDFVFSNAFMARRIDLINPSFKGLPSDWLQDEFEVPKKPPCIMSTLTEIKSALPVEAAAMKEYKWKPVIKAFFKKGILKGNSDQLLGLLDVAHFDTNLKSLNNLYETYVLSVGEFDERIFLGEHANEQIGTKSNPAVSGDEISQVISTFGPSGRACPDTPLTGRGYLGAAREALTPVSEAHNSLARLAAYTRHAKPMPSAHLLRLFATAGAGPDQTPVSEAHNSLARLAAYTRHAKPMPSAHLLRLFATAGAGPDQTPVSEAHNSLARLAAYTRHAKPMPSAHLLHAGVGGAQQPGAPGRLHATRQAHALGAPAAPVRVSTAGAGPDQTPVSEAHNSLARLAAYTRHAKPMPSAHLLRLFAECGVNEETINNNIIQPCNGWMEQFANSLRESNCSEQTIQFRCNMVTCLYYKVFEHIIREEHRKKPQVSLQMLLTQETYQLTVYACCTEVVLHAYGVHSLRFPRVLQIYGLSAFHFYKIIELVVQAVVEKLSRDVIKHLNTVEEEVLESLVWTSDSPLWDQLAKYPVPASTDVYVQESPLSRRNNNSILSLESAAIDRFLSPMADQTKRQLFKDNIKPGQSLLAVKSEPNSSEPSTSASNGDPSLTPKKSNNSLNLFFRKFYSLAVVRMNDLCARLRLAGDELKRKIWTCLEHALMKQSQLMRDRHLDQILMCTVYVVCKVSNNANNPVERTFAEIMRCYRQRPLADNHVYRSVLITPATEDSPAERSDLIKFYNKVYVQCMQDFALRFAGRQKEECCLSPLPAGRGDAAYSPAGQRVSDRHQVYVKPLTSPLPAHHHLTYRFSRSPAKDLHAINTMVSCEVGGLKRGGGAGGAALKRPRLGAAGVARKLHGLMTDRQAV